MAPSPPNRRWIILIPLLSAVALGLVMIGLRARTGDLALRIRIIRALNEGKGQPVVMSNMAAFTWDKLVVLEPRASSDKQAEVAALPFYVRWMVSLSSRDDICVLAFKVRQRYRGHVVMPRASADFVPAVRTAAYTTYDAVFAGTPAGTGFVVSPAEPLQGQAE